MSSYFDTMARCAVDPKAVAELVKRQYGHYLRQLNEECLAKDLDRLNELIVQFDRIKANNEDGPEWAIQEMHTLAHKLGSANIRLRRGRRASDNPSLLY